MAIRAQASSFQIIPLPSDFSTGTYKFWMAGGRIIYAADGSYSAIVHQNIEIHVKSFLWLDTIGEKTVTNTTSTPASGYILIAVLDKDKIFQHLIGDLFMGGGYNGYFAVTTRPKEGGGYEYQVATGGIYLPNGVANGVAAKDWATAPTGTIYLHLSINEGTLTATYAETIGTVAKYADPATLSFYIAGIDADGVVTQVQYGPIDLTGALIPAWYAGYAAASIQSFQHLANAAPSWDTDGACT